MNTRNKTNIKAALRWLSKKAETYKPAATLFDELERLQTEAGKDLLERMPSIQQQFAINDGFGYVEAVQQRSLGSEEFIQTYSVVFVMRIPKAPFIP